MTVYAATATARASAPPPGIAVGTRMLLHWSDIAIEQERLAWAGRRALEEQKAGGTPLELTRELGPSLIALAAVSHALDALYGELRDLVLPEELRARWKDRRPARWRQIHETLKYGLRIPAQRWVDELKTLFRLRDAAVHPETVFGEPKQHPVGVNTAVEYVVYGCERATRSIDLLFEILETCVERPKPAIEQWASDLRSPLESRKVSREGRPP